MIIFKGTDSSVRGEKSKLKPSIEISKCSLGIDPTNLHLLPFSIGHNGHAKVSSFFHIKNEDGMNSKLYNQQSVFESKTLYIFTLKSKTKTKGVLSSTFRGIRLYGTSLKLPSCYNGFVYRADNNSNNSNSSIKDDTVANKWELLSKFDSFNYWNREKKPTIHDPVQQAMKWMDISQHIYKPVTKEMMEQEKNRMEEEDSLLDSKNKTTLTEEADTSKTTEKEIDEKVTDKVEEKTEDQDDNNDRPKKRVRNLFSRHVQVETYFLE
ncbi:hypothetical protein PPL_08117 [Heterostelium album PN500]|uniref:Uncharacterized protein n=1 Tax=Heterostelium pallidum (strain ATCC 26659 / Pp 5 / PN500) TaxID=670386 RepID=D3BIN7_HETP5|nr:hypothetical protein PPL_08117 [Heterostelium album PN500]EFA78661.1 hypothetical protein PPL_08117 [Heterostelium album PN500]|eukprot:XP_020430785.1 hypothetical protein PPL_08117 [Heterostelium album PN500]